MLTSISPLCGNVSSLPTDQRDLALAVPYYTDDVSLQKSRPEIFWVRPRTPLLRRSPNYHKGGVFLFRNATVAGAYAVILDCQSLFVSTQCGSPSREQSVNEFTQKKNIIHINGTAVLLYQFFANAYFHSLVETFPRIATMIEYLQANPEVVILSGSNNLKYKISGCQLEHIAVPSIPLPPIFCKLAWRCTWSTGFATRRSSTSAVTASTITRTPLIFKEKVILLQKREVRRITNHPQLA